jgi:c-di-GMP-binding flagellar brake protein YcgR
MSENPIIERRRDKRFKKQLLITTMFRDDTGNMVVEDNLYSEDISAGGLRLNFPHEMPKGKIIDLKVFFFSDPIHLPAQGKVIWSKKKQALEVAVGDKKRDDESELYWMGIQFVNIDAFNRERIMRWIEKGFAEDAT